MEYTGLTRSYPVHRPLTSQEHDQQLRQRQKFDLEAAYQLSVIRTNSTYLELVDKYYAWKGFISTGMLAGCAIVFWMLGAMTIYSLITPGRLATDWPYLAFLYVFAAPALVLCIWLIRKESFAYTHYPMRFNRKTRMVHVFRLDGTVLSVPWDDVFFCLAPAMQGFWNIRGHVLDADGRTVKETFSLPIVAGKSAGDRQVMLGFWEFVRSYMEEGPQQAASLVKICLPIAERRERPIDGFRRLHAEGSLNVFTSLAAAVIAIAIAPGRWFAIQTSKVPVWPREIEDRCRVNPDDRFSRDASMNAM